MEIADREQEILKFWRERRIFEKSLAQTKEKKPFVFFEGPPTANAGPGLHHVLARTFKDIFCRYQTMLGRFVLRKGGWDTHGLPVELQVEKELGFSSKKDIEAYGIGAFNARCKASVWKYKEEWERLTDRMGFWLDLADPYITYEPRYMETLWWVIQQIDRKKLLERDYAVVPYCPRCGTPLSSHEVAQGYERVKDAAITVRFPLQDGSASLLIWTTTPWTLVGNVAVAVHPELSYVRVRPKGSREVLIVAKGLEERVFGEGNWEYAQGGRAEMLGKDRMAGLEYKPPYRYGTEAQFPHRVVTADYVSAEEGTGLVHIAAFGEEDMGVIRRYGLPTVVPVREDGTFAEDVEKFGGQSVKDADSAIIADLKSRELLFSDGMVEHDYPFCWRCKTPLLYYPRSAWFVRMTKFRDQLVKENQKVTWVPDHLRDGRFGEWLREVKDWNISRERYWGTPLPIWECDQCERRNVIGAVREFPLEHRNVFFILRHGGADHNAEGSLAGRRREETNPPRLTVEGRKQVETSAQKLKNKGITRIIVSPYARTQETAAIVAGVLGLPVETDSRLSESDSGIYGAHTAAEYNANFRNRREYFEKVVEGGESRLQVQARMVRAVKDINETREGERILIVSHGDPLMLLQGAFEGWSYEELLHQKRTKYIQTGEWRELTVRNIPTDAEGYLDLHRPFVDAIVWPCSCGGAFRRIPEVADVWFDSGAMPFAQWHYPFEMKGVVDGKGTAEIFGHEHEEWSDEGVSRQFPADFIAEGIDQTRGWFYTLLAVGVLLGKGAPYRAVVSPNLVLDEKGQKMSKSRGNIVNPWDIFDRYGADVVRWTLTVMNPAGEVKRFSERELRDRKRRVFDTVENVLRFYRLYASSIAAAEYGGNSSRDVLDRWMLSRLHHLIRDVRESMDRLDATSAGRATEQFVDELSNWYVRRSRRRFQRPETPAEHSGAARTLRVVLRGLARVMAPIAPFTAEAVFQTVRYHGDAESVHLSPFPSVRDAADDPKLEAAMRQVREAASEALRQRASAGVPVRQPLQRLRVPHEFSPELRGILAEEVNAKEVVQQKGGVVLETVLTEELRREGWARELTRAIQDLRKRAGFSPSDTIVAGIDASLLSLVAEHRETVARQTRAKEITSVLNGVMWDAEGTITLGETEGRIGVRRI